MEHSESNEEKIILDQESSVKCYAYLSVKYIFDFVAGCIGLALLVPLFLVVSIAIKVEDPAGAVFYTQTRLGKGQKPFKIFKFRSMVSNADNQITQLLVKNEIDGAMFKIKEDPRVTRVGHWIRKYSVDELPQLLNVLLGDMSLVGPRPPLPREVTEYTEYDKQRLVVKPGCTGLWQATMRNKASFKEMVNIDLTYIKERTFILDLKILWLTLFVFVKPNT